MVEGYPSGLGGWGAPAIFKEAGRLLGKYFRILHPFILAFFLPVAVIQLLEIYGAAWMFSHHPHHPHHHHPHHHGDHPFGFHHHRHGHHHHPFGGFHSFYAHHHEGRMNFDGDAFAPAPHPHPPHPHPPHPSPPLLPLLIGALVMILVWVLVSLAIAAISKVVAYIYSDNNEEEEDSSIVKSIFQSLPSALYRLFITTLWVLLFTVATVFIISLPFHLILWLLSSKVNHHIIFIINNVVVDIALLVLGFVFLLSGEVAVLEPENFGLAALKRSFRLVESKIVAAIIFFLVNIIVAGLISKLAKLAVFLPVTGKVPYWTVWIFGVIVAVLYLIFTVYFLLVAIVLYFSTKLKSESDHHYLPVNSGEDNPYTPLVVPAEN